MIVFWGARQMFFEFWSRTSIKGGDPEFSGLRGGTSKFGFGNFLGGGSTPGQAMVLFITLPTSSTVVQYIYIAVMVTRYKVK